MLLARISGTKLPEQICVELETNFISSKISRRLIKLSEQICVELETNFISSKISWRLLLCRCPDDLQRRPASGHRVDVGRQ